MFTKQLDTNGAITKYLRSAHRNLDPAMALIESVAVLAGVSADEVEGLKKGKIETIFDLVCVGSFRRCNAARSLICVTRLHVSSAALTCCYTCIY